MGSHPSILNTCNLDQPSVSPSLYRFRRRYHCSVMILVTVLADFLFILRIVFTICMTLGDNEELCLIASFCSFPVYLVFILDLLLDQVPEKSNREDNLNIINSSLTSLYTVKIIIYSILVNFSNIVFLQYQFGNTMLCT